MKVSSHQSSLFPWAGYWNKLVESDVHIVSTGIKFNYGNYQSRVPSSDTTWLTLPIIKKTTHDRALDVRFDKEVLPKFLKTVEQTYGGKRWLGGDKVRHIVSHLRDHTKTEFLLDLNLMSMDLVADVLGIKKNWVVDVIRPEDKDSKTIRLTSRVRRSVPDGPIQYLAGSGALGYINLSELPDGFEFMVQKSRGKVPCTTVLQLIAQEEDPLSVIKSSFWWENTSEENIDSVPSLR